MEKVKSILEAAERGDPQAASQLLPLVYDELRRMAAQKMAMEQPGQTLDATGLVHEAYLRLVGSQPEQAWNGRGHFFAAAAEAMRRILIDRARRKQRVRHGGNRERVPLDEANMPAKSEEDRLLVVDQAVEQLSTLEPEIAQLVKLRYYGGLTIEQSAEVLGISVRTANRHWAFARAWLHRQLGDSFC